MKTSALEVGTVYRLTTRYAGDQPVAVLDTRRRWRVREWDRSSARPEFRANVWAANGATIPDGYRAPTPDVVGVPVLELRNAGRGFPDHRLARLLDAARAVLSTGELPDLVDMGEVRAAIDAALPGDIDTRLIGPRIVVPQNIRCPWPGVRGRAPLPEDVRYTIREETRS